MANELMLRLVYQGKIVGFEWRVQIGNDNELAIERSITQNFDIWFRQWSESFSDMFTHDSFDLGVQVNGTWMFEGDVMENIDYKIRGTVCRDDTGRWVIAIMDGLKDKPYPLIEHALYWRVVGNIHEETAHGTL